MMGNISEGTVAILTRSDSNSLEVRAMRFLESDPVRRAFRQRTVVDWSPLLEMCQGEGEKATVIASVLTSVCPQISSEVANQSPYSVESRIRHFIEVFTYPIRLQLPPDTQSYPALQLPENYNKSSALEYGWGATIAMFECVTWVDNYGYPSVLDEHMPRWVAEILCYQWRLCAQLDSSVSMSNSTEHRLSEAIKTYVRPGARVKRNWRWRFVVKMLEKATSFHHKPLGLTNAGLVILDQLCYGLFHRDVLSSHERAQILINGFRGPYAKRITE